MHGSTGSALRGAIAGICLAAALAGCSGAQAGSAPPEVTATPVASDPAALVLPIEQYLYTPAQTDELSTAMYLGVRRCMAEFGYSLPARSMLGSQYSGGLVPLRYGPSDMTSAGTYGYHRPPPPGGAKVMAQPVLSATERYTYFGPRAGTSDTAPATPEPTAAHGRPVPRGGCLAQAQRDIAGDAVFGQSPIAEQIKQAGYAASTADPRVVAVFHQWSACMRGRGYSYPDPVRAYEDPRWNTPSATTAEIAAAKADVTCKRQTNLVGVWFAVESAYQDQQIGQQRAGLAAERAAKGEQLAKAARILQNPDAAGTP